MSGCHGGILIAVENKFLSSTHIRFSSKSEFDCTVVMESPHLSYEGFVTHDSSSTVFSMHSFDAEKFAQSMAVTKSLANDCHSSRPGFISLFYKLLDTALDKCISKKRRKRVNTPYTSFLRQPCIA